MTDEQQPGPSSIDIYSSIILERTRVDTLPTFRLISNLNIDNMIAGLAEDISRNPGQEVYTLLFPVHVSPILLGPTMIALQRTRPDLDLMSIQKMARLATSTDEHSTTWRSRYLKAQEPIKTYRITDHVDIAGGTYEVTQVIDHTLTNAAFLDLFADGGRIEATLHQSKSVFGKIIGFDDPVEAPLWTQFFQELATRIQQEFPEHNQRVLMCPVALMEGSSKATIAANFNDSADVYYNITEAYNKFRCCVEDLIAYTKTYRQNFQTVLKEIAQLLEYDFYQLDIPQINPEDSLLTMVSGFRTGETIQTPQGRDIPITEAVKLLMDRLEDSYSEDCRLEDFLNEQEWQRFFVEHAIFMNLRWNITQAEGGRADLTNEDNTIYRGYIQALLFEYTLQFKEGMM